ncbi:COG1565: Uncharacterized conserved protein [plant metagenome]|uniref:COG1565: Uncharacterized conserved protein n=1 Tax=plant metagenome TaxID=1297885 RepID=A0A484SIM8_9ZZZZ
MSASATPPPRGLPPLHPDALAHGARVAAHLAECVQAAGGWLPFDAYMREALYAPGLGYYAAGSAKLDAGDVRAPAGDFTTAPELTPLFGHTLARQIAEVLDRSGANRVLEFGAGSGALARSVLDALRAEGRSIRYDILEVSADLRARQQTALAAHGDAVQWLDALPSGFQGCVIANEVLDAMPARRAGWNGEGAVLEYGVVLGAAAAADAPAFAWEARPADAALREALAERMPALPGYVTEINLQAEAWVRDLGTWLTRGAAILIDYGFPRHEFYHPQRAEGTLMCHLRHHAHPDPFVAPGLQDITAHVDFTAMADAALAGGLDVLGYTSQARFLGNAGLLTLLSQADATDVRAHAARLAPVQRLLSEAEMGELFKVLAVGRDIDPPLLGFLRGDRRGAL